MSKYALRIGRPFGISVFVHWTFLLLLVGVAAFYLVGGKTLAAAVSGILLLLAVFGCVVLHELGHALAAQRFGVETRDITLYPIGGVARLQRIPEEPMQEFWIAIAGPAVNVLIAVLLFGYLIVTGGDAGFTSLQDARSNFAGTLMWVNVILFAFNLLPAFPMDGGRVLRAILASRMNYGRATELAANVGQGMAILFGLLGLLSFNPILLFIAIFVYVGAQQEARQAMLKNATEGISVRQAMMTRYQTLDASDTLGRAVDELIAGADQDFPVLDGGRLVGILTRKDLVRALGEHGRDARLRDLGLPACGTVTDAEMLDRAFTRMQESSCTTLAVLNRGALVGLLTLENVGELMMISSALQSSGRDRTLQNALDGAAGPR